MPQRILGLDLGARAVKGVLLESTFRGYTVLGAASAAVSDAASEHGPPLVERQAAAAAELLRSQAWRAEVVVLAFPGTGASSHVLTLPFTDARRIEQTVQFEVEGQIPFDLADVAWDWQPIGTRGGKTDLHVAVVRKADLAALLAALAPAGVDPRLVLPPGPAYAALAGSGALAGEAATGNASGAEVILDVGLERSTVCVVAGGACEAARTFGGGVGPLARELRATLRAWQARVGQRPVRRLVLAGDLAHTPGLAEQLGAEVAAPAEPVLLAGSAAERIAPPEAPAYALALALALRGHQSSRGPRLNLRRGELAYTRDFQHVRGKVVRLAVYAGLVLLLALVSSGVKVAALSHQEALLDKALCDAEQKVLGKCFDSFEQAEAVLKGRGTPSAGIPRLSAVDLLAELSNRAAADVPMRLERIEITRERLHLQGTTEAAENVDKIVSSLRASRCFGDARSGGARRRSSDGKFEFSIDSDLTCEGAAAPGGKG